MKEFNLEELATFNGQEPGKPVYLARDGKVYDVSGSKLWKGGNHMRRHQAGNDLSPELAAAPHGVEVFERVTQVGVIKARSGPAAIATLPPWLEGLLARVPFLARHPHPMLVHYPIVFTFSVLGFTLLALVTGNPSFGATALHCLVALVLFLPLAMLSGFTTWWINYQARPIRPVMIKFWCSTLLLMDAIVLLIWRLRVPDILAQPGPERLGYLLLVGSLAVLVGVIGWFGAMLTFPLEKK